MTAHCLCDMCNRLLNVLLDLTASEYSKMAICNTGYTYILAGWRDRNNISNALSVFSGSAYPIRLLKMSRYLSGSDESKMKASKTGYTSLSTCKRERSVVINVVLSSIIRLNVKCHWNWRSLNRKYFHLGLLTFFMPHSIHDSPVE